MNEPKKMPNFLTKKQLVDKHKFLTENMVKNFLHKNIGNIRGKCTKKIGRIILIDEEKFFQFIDESDPFAHHSRGNKFGKANKKLKE